MPYLSINQSFRVSVSYAFRVYWPNCVMRVGRRGALNCHLYIDQNSQLGLNQNWVKVSWVIVIPSIGLWPMLTLWVIRSGSSFHGDNPSEVLLNIDQTRLVAKVSVLVRLIGGLGPIRKRWEKRRSWAGFLSSQHFSEYMGGFQLKIS